MCDCRGIWAENIFQPQKTPHTSRSIKLCVDCGRQINPKRIEVQSGTVWCIDCAEDHRGGQANRFIDEPLGRREDFLRDRAAFKTQGR